MTTKGRTMTSMLSLIKTGTNPTADWTHEQSILGMMGAGLISRDAVALNSYIRATLRGVVSHNKEKPDMKWIIETINNVLAMIGDEL